MRKNCGGIRGLRGHGRCWIGDIRLAIRGKLSFAGVVTLRVVFLQERFWDYHVGVWCPRSEGDEFRIVVFHIIRREKDTSIGRFRKTEKLSQE